MTDFFASHPANGIYSFVLTSPNDERIDFCDQEISQPYLYIRVAAIDKTSDTFDKYIINQNDISFNVKFDDTVNSILIDGNILESSNYTVSGSIVTISKNFLSTLSLGSHTFTINLKQCSPQILTIDVVDTTPLDSTPPAIISVTGNPAEWQNTDVTLTVNAIDDESGVAAYSFDNGVTWQSENSKTYSANTSNILIKVKDNAGNITTYETAVNITKIDKTAPTIVFVTGNSAWQNTPVPIYVTAEDHDSGIAAYSFDDGATWQESNSMTFSENQSIVIKVKDNAGNISSLSFNVTYIDTTAPTGEISIGANSWREFLNTITFGLFFKETVTVTITGSDEGGSGVKSIEYYKSSEQLSEDEVKALTTWSAYTEALSLTPVDAEKFVFYVKITDNARNIKYISSDGSTFDIQAPSISTDYVKGADSMEITVNDTGAGIGAVSYTVNGGTAVTAAPDANGNFTVPLADGKYEVVITASDALGNQSSMTVHVVSLHKVIFKLFEGDTGEPLKTETVEYGVAATAPDDPTRTGFVFAGWDKAFDNITADITVNATWNIAGITVTPYTGVYDNAPHNAVTVSGTLAGDTVSYSTDGSTFKSEMPTFTDAGTYIVYVKVERTGYAAWVSEALNVVIDKKPITTDMIADIPSFKYTSKPITPKPQVKFSGYTLIEDKDYTISYVSNTEVGSASVKITGKGNYMGEAVKAFAIYAKKTEVKIEGKEAPQVTVDGLDDLYEDKNVYTDDDKVIEKDGGSISIELSVKLQTKETEDKAKIEDIAKDKTIGIYLDISLYKKVTKPNQPEGTTTRITQLEDVLTVIIPIPDNMKGKPGLALYRVHNGVASVVPVGKENAVDGEYCEINADSITLYVRNFSTYAIGFDDKNGGTTPTGDKFAALAVFGLVAFGIFAFTFFKRKRKRVE